MSKKIIIVILIIGLCCLTCRCLSAGEPIFWGGNTNIVAVAIGYQRTKELITGEYLPILTESASANQTNNLGVLFFTISPKTLTEKYFFLRNTLNDPENVSNWYLIGEYYYFPFIETRITFENSKRCPQTLLKSDLFTSQSAACKYSSLYLHSVVGMYFYKSLEHVSQAIEHLELQQSVLEKKVLAAKNQLELNPRPAKENRSHNMMKKFLDSYSALKDMEAEFFTVQIKIKEACKQKKSMEIFEENISEKRMPKRVSPSLK